MAGTPDKKGRGRPTAYHKSFVKISFQLCRQHAYTDVKLAEVLGIGLTTLYQWKEKYPEFREAVQGGKDVFDKEYIESALVKRAKGFVRKRLLQRTFTRAGLKTTEITEVAEEVAGSVEAQKFWLVNRNPQRWKQLVQEPKDEAAQQQEQKPGLLVVPADVDWEKWKLEHQPDPPANA
jgi:hypothetical protein